MITERGGAMDRILEFIVKTISAMDVAKMLDLAPEGRVGSSSCILVRSVSVQYLRSSE